ncbi:MAG: hypothetical protein VKL59_05915 [Nostocaceae cyanobacterium]|nr:hypothetical protein [Nostocaceae cyanobacterium]
MGQGKNGITHSPLPKVLGHEKLVVYRINSLGFVLSDLSLK